MKKHNDSGRDAAYVAPGLEVKRLEAGRVIAASGTFNTDPWNNGNGNNQWCN